MKPTTHHKKDFAAAPLMSEAALQSSEDELIFALAWNGVDHPFVLERATLMQIDGQPTGRSDLKATFERHRSKIIGVASRALRAGITNATGTPTKLRPAHFG